MIEIYNVDNDNYSFNGDMTLLPTLCDVRATINGAWQLEIQHSIDDDGRYRYIIENAVVKVPSFNGDQLFRISEKELTLGGVTAYAYPIFLDAADELFLMDNRPTNLNGQNALNWMLSGQSKYSGQSNITKISTAYYIRKNFIEAIASDDEQSFLNRWGGEIYYNNYTIIIDDRIGIDNGVEIRYGKNMTEMAENINLDSVITRIIPEAYNGYTLDGSEPWVDSDLIDNYPKIYNRLVYFDDVKLQSDCQGDEVGFETIEELQDELVRRSELMFTQDHVDEPQIELTVSLELLANTEEYKDLQIIEDISLGDTVYCIHDKFGIRSEARVASLEYDCIHQKNKSVTLGTVRQNIMDSISESKKRIESVIDKKTGDIMAEKVSGFLDGIRTQLRVQKSASQTVDAIGILFEDLDPESATFGAMGIGTQGFMISRQRDSSGRDWVWQTAGTAAGLVATAMVLGTLSDRNGNFVLNLDDGTLNIKDNFTIVAEDGSKDFKTTIDELNNQISNNSGAIDTIESEMTGLTGEGGTIETIETSITQSAQQMKIYSDSAIENALAPFNAYFDFSDIGLKIGDVTSLLALLLKNDAIHFLNDGKSVLHITPYDTLMPRLHVTEIFQLGRYYFKVWNDGSFSISWEEV